jgi:hypothetical protein
MEVLHSENYGNFDVAEIWMRQRYYYYTTNWSAGSYNRQRIAPWLAYWYRENFWRNFLLMQITGEGSTSLTTPLQKVGLHRCCGKSSPKPLYLVPSSCRCCTDDLVENGRYALLHSRQKIGWLNRGALMQNWRSGEDGTQWPPFLVYTYRLSALMSGNSDSNE